jgi:anaerobic ribonucleoside-triphosphate reductase activating protein
MHYGALKNCDIANGPGIRVSLFVSGCRNHCPGCFQPETWDFNYGDLYTEETEKEILKLLSNEYVDGLSLLGGDPFEPENQAQLVLLMKKCKKNFPEKTIWIYTGYTYEKLISGNVHPCCEWTKEMLSLTDVLVDGRFIEDEKDISLQFRGSRNQRIIDIPETIKTGNIVIIPDKKRGSIK